MDEKNLNWPVTVTLFAQERYDGDWMPEKLTEAVAWLQNFLAQVPDEHRNEATIDIGYEEYSANIDISYQRPATEAEKQERLSNERRQTDRSTAERRQHYERLKTEFGE